MDMFQSLLLLSGIKKAWPQLTEEDVRRHNTRTSLWIVSGNSVYDVTPFLRSHPGGEAALLRRGGGTRDCTEDFAFHSRYARRVWEDSKVGELAPGEREKLFLSVPQQSQQQVSLSSGPALSQTHCCGGGSNSATPSTLKSNNSNNNSSSSSSNSALEVGVSPSSTTTVPGRKAAAAAGGSCGGRCAHCGR